MSQGAKPEKRANQFGSLIKEIEYPRKCSFKVTIETLRHLAETSICLRYLFPPVAGKRNSGRCQNNDLQ